jgi:hypothetical protein
MKPWRISLGVLALGALAATVPPAEAAWDNVFQVTCWNKGPRTSGYYYAPPAVAYYGPPAVAAYSSPGCCDPCPQQCTTKYVQRCYYQPVVSYQTKTYYEPVTTYTKSYYYEPVTTYRYSSYYDPCSCSCQKVAIPCTSYQLREKCCPVQSWVQRCTQEPVTTYQKSFYWEPQTTCCQASCCGSTPGAPMGTAAGPPPQVDLKQTAPPPQVEGSGDGGNPAYDKYFKQLPQPQSQYRQLTPNGQPSNPAKTVSPASPPPSVKLEKIAQNGATIIDGKVVSDKNAPKTGVQLTFVSVQKQSADKVVTSNAAGQFQVELPAGSWLVYMRAADGQYVFHSRIDIDAKQKTPVILVSR